MMRFAQSDLIGFLRHGQEGLNKEKSEGNSMYVLLFPSWHYSMPPAPGYPLTGCTPAEPASVSPGNWYLTGHPIIFFFCAVIQSMPVRTIEGIRIRQCGADSVERPWQAVRPPSD